MKEFRNLTVIIGNGLNVLAWRSLSVIDDLRCVTDC